MLTQEIAKQAVEFTLPSIKKLMKYNTFKRRDLHIAIADPTYSRSKQDETEWLRAGILYEHSIGDPSRWEYKFDRIARSKCYLSWVHNMPTQILQTHAPFVLVEGDTLYYGSAVSDGLVVACSGVQPFFDQMISAWVLEACRALCIQKREELLLTNKDGWIPVSA